MVMSNKRLFLLLLLAVCSWMTCLDEIDIANAERPEVGYVVQGKLLMGTASSLFEATVEQMFVYTSNINQRIRDVQVTLVGDDGQQLVLTSAPIDGVYRQNLAQSEFAVAVGKKYRLEVVLSTGEQLVSAWEEIMPLPEAGSLSWQFDELEVVGAGEVAMLAPALAYRIDASVQASEGSKAQLRWEFIDAYKITDDLGAVCYVENPFQASEVILLDGAEVSGDTVADYPLFKSLINQKHIEGYYLTAYQQALTPNSFAYWKEVAALLEREGTVFDNPAGLISTNMESPTNPEMLLFGQFSAYQQDTLRLYISREDMGSPTFYCPRPPSNQPMPPITICDGCIDAIGAAYDKPFYWEE